MKEVEFNFKQNIDVLPLSVRAYNALRNNKIETVEMLLMYHEEDLMNIKNIGKKTVDELLELQRKLMNGELNGIRNSKGRSSQTIEDYILMHQQNEKNQEYRIQFLDAQQIWQNNLLITDINFSNRVQKIFGHQKLTNVRELLAISTQELREYQNMGEKSFQEILKLVLEITQVQFLEPLSLGEQQVQDAILEWLNNDIKNCPVSFQHNHYTRLVLKALEAILHADLQTWQEQATNISEVLYEDVAIAEWIKNFIVEQLISEDRPISQQALANYLPSSFVHGHYFFEYRDELLAAQNIEWFGTKIRVYRPSILAYIDTLKKEAWREAVLGRLQGKTLEEIGQSLGITRERVRQIVKTVLAKKPAVSEDDYLEFLKNYELSQKMFCTVFGVDDYVFEYGMLIMSLTEKKQHEMKPAAELLYDERLTAEMKQRLYRELNKNKLHCDGEIIDKNRLDLIIFTIKKFAQHEIGFSEFYQKHCDFLASYGLDEADFSYPERSMESVIARQETAVWKYGRKLRYYPMNAYDFSEFLTAINWYEQQDVELSTFKFFCEYPEVMRDYDIRDEYELHNILKKLPIELVGTHVQLTRMPYVQFGNCDRERQVLELLYELAPIAREDLAIAFEERYGHLRLTISGYFSTVLDNYLDNGIYKVDEVELTEAELECLRANLDREFYFKDEFKMIFQEVLPGVDTIKINNQNLRSLGYRPNTNYLFSTKYPTATAYFNDWIMRNSSFSLSERDLRLWNLQIFAKTITDLRKDFTLIEQQPNYFVQITEYEKQGLTLSTILDWVEQFIETCDEAYFTIYSLREKGYEFPFDMYGFTDWTYASVLSQFEAIQSRRFKDTILLKKQANQIALVDFAIETIQQFQSIAISDYIEWVAKTYQLEVNRERLIETMKMTPLYFDQQTKMIYATVQRYEEIMESQFVDLDDTWIDIESLGLDDF